MASAMTIEEYDAIIVGAGFSGVYLLQRLREEGFRVHVYDSGPMLGGTWCNNRYPGARVDSSIPVYELSDNKLWKDWKWREKFPGWRELQAYFQHVDRKLGLMQDVTLNFFVTRAVWNEELSLWEVYGVRNSDRKATNGKQESNVGNTASTPQDDSQGKNQSATFDAESETMVGRSRFFLPCLGFASKKYVPKFHNLDKFKGEMYHTTDWPLESEKTVSFTDRHIAVVGTGATGVQVVQEIGNDNTFKTLSVFQRTPNFCIPMQQKKFDLERSQDMEDKELYQEVYKLRRQTFSGMEFGWNSQSCLEVTSEEREAFLEELFRKGGFGFWLGNYYDILFNEEANRLVYDFWKRKTRKRILNPETARILAPDVPPHPFGTKRPSLETNYFEQFNKPNVQLIDCTVNGIREFTADGCITQDGKHHRIDLLVLATGFDSVTGGMTQMDIRGLGGLSLRDKWKNRTTTYLGLTVAGFPNMFFTYGAQAPTAFCNGPSCIEAQADWICQLMIRHREAESLKYVVASIQAETEWTRYVNELCQTSLLPLAKSWYMGANIPGKPIESLNYPGGLPDYLDKCHWCAANEYQGFEFGYA